MISSRGSFANFRAQYGLDQASKRLRATRSPFRQPQAASSTPPGVSQLSDEELKEKLEYIMGPPEEPDPEELSYTGPRWRLTPRVIGPFPCMQLRTTRQAVLRMQYTGAC